MLVRWIFLALVALNLIFAVWHLQRAPLEGRSVGPVPGYDAERNPIQLLTEARGAGAISEAPPQCLRLGTVGQAATARLLAQRLLSLDIDAQLISSEQAIGRDYWVYLPPVRSREAALRLLRELQARNIDSYVITVGELTNGVSLGIFTQQATAQAVASSVEESGYEVDVKVIPRVQSAYWLQVSPEASRLMDDSVLTMLRQQEPGLQSRRMRCESIAAG